MTKQTNIRSYVKALKKRDARACVRAYTRLMEDLTGMYRRLESGQTNKVGSDDV